MLIADAKSLEHANQLVSAAIVDDESFHKLYSEPGELTTEGRLACARTIAELGEQSHNQPMEALALLQIGRMSKSGQGMKPLLKCLSLYEKSEENVLSTVDYAKLCLALAKEFQSEDKKSSLFYLEQVYQL